MTMTMISVDFKSICCMTILHILRDPYPPPPPTLSPYWPTPLNISGVWIADKYSTLVALEGDSKEATAGRSRVDPDLQNLVRGCEPSLPAASSSSSPNSLVCVAGQWQHCKTESSVFHSVSCGMSSAYSERLCWLEQCIPQIHPASPCWCKGNNLQLTSFVKSPDNARSSVNGEVGLGSHSLSHSSIVPNKPCNFCGCEQAHHISKGVQAVNTQYACCWQCVLLFINRWNTKRWWEVCIFLGRVWRLWQWPAGNEVIHRVSSVVWVCVCKYLPVYWHAHFLVLPAHRY